MPRLTNATHRLPEQDSEGTVTNRNWIYIALLAALALAITLLVINADVPSDKRQRVVLDELGCQAALRLGVKVTASEAGICELDERVSLTLYWLTIGTVRIDAKRVVAVQDAD